MLEDEAFDPVAHAGRAELEQECGIPMEATNTIDLHLGAVLHYGVNFALGQRFKEQWFGGHGITHVVPLLGVCHSPEPPPIKLKQDELSAYAWVPLQEIADRPNLSPGY